MGDRILVVQGASYYKAVDGLGEFTAKVSDFMKNPADFKLVLFTGGADVDPKFYGDSSPRNICFTNPQRDLYETAIYKKALKAGILMTGICRGLQFLNVMNGGKMMHHLTNHETRPHELVCHNGIIIQVNTLHHQMILPPPGAIITCYCPPISKYYVGQGDKEIEYRGIEIEGAIFPKTKSFGVQYHPEMMGDASKGYLYYFNMVRRSLSMGWEEFVDHYTPRAENVEHTTLHESNDSTA